MKRTAFVAFSLATHLSIFLALHSVAMKAPPIKRKPIEVALIEHKETPPPAPEPPKKTEHLKVVPKVLPTPQAAPPKNEPPPPPVFGISLSSTDAQGNFNVAVGNTTLTDPKNTGKDVRPLSGNGQGKAPVSLAQLSKLPEKIGDCPPTNPSGLYTQTARDANIEGDVVVETVLSDSGKVTRTRVVRGLGYGLDEAATKAIKEQCKFKPAEMNGEKVGTTITLTFHFIIDE